jgi:LysR family nitrogen assimilation transcriptional regulator
MNFVRLRYFQKVAELQSLRRAAEVLHVSQPALTRQIQVLEREIGSDLFLRVNQRLQLTPAGQILMSRAEKILNEISTIIGDIRRLDEQKGDRLVIGAVQSTMAHVLPRAIDQVKRDFPKVRIEISGFRSSEIISRVIGGELDMGLVSSPNIDPRLQCEPIARDPFVAVVNSGHHLADQRVVTLGQVVGHPLVTFPVGFPIRDRIAAAARNRELDLSVAVELDSIEAIKGLVRAGVGITLLPLAAVLGDSMDGGLKTLGVDADDLTRELVAARRTAEPLLPSFRRLIVAIRCQFPPDCRRPPS